jgi:hypothetical protein
MERGMRKVASTQGIRQFCQWDRGEILHELKDLMQFLESLAIK